MQKVDFITVRIDVRSKYDGGNLDEDIEAEQIKGISVLYEKRGGGKTGKLQSLLP